MDTFNTANSGERDSEEVTLADGRVTRDIGYAHYLLESSVGSPAAGADLEVSQLTQYYAVDHPQWLRTKAALTALGESQKTIVSKKNETLEAAILRSYTSQERERQRHPTTLVSPPTREPLIEEIGSYQQGQAEEISDDRGNTVLVVPGEHKVIGLVGRDGEIREGGIMFDAVNRETGELRTVVEFRSTEDLRILQQHGHIRMKDGFNLDRLNERSQKQERPRAADGESEKKRSVGMRR